MPVKALYEIFKTNLGVRKPDRVLVFTDRPAKGEAMDEAELARRTKLRDIARIAAETARGFSDDVRFLEYPSLMGHGKEPPEELWKLAFSDGAVEALKRQGLLVPIRRKQASPEKLEKARSIINRYKRSGVDAVVALSNFSTSHTMFRNFLTGICAVRYASMPLFDMAMFEGPMRADYRKLNKATKAVATALRKSVSVHITTPAGTDIAFSTKGRRAEADTGILTKPGSFGNLPAGEAYLAPVEGTAEGKLVLEWGPTHKLDTPIVATVREGLVTGVAGKDPYAKVLRAKLKERAENANIAELGIGTNPLARRPDNILESEKILGTIHIAFGDNASFGGTVKAPYHQDFVFFMPTLTMTLRDGTTEQLITEGKLNI